MDKRVLGIKFAEAATLAKELDKDMHQALAEGDMPKANRLQFALSNANLKAAQAYSHLYSECDSLAAFLVAVQAGYDTVQGQAQEDKGEEAKGGGYNLPGVARCCE